jgi:glycosyltransferase involved in cell wall biosynthesis
MLEGLSLRYAAAWASRDHSGVVLSNAFMPGSNTTPYERSSVLTIGHLSNLTEVKGVIRFLDLFRAAKIKGIHIRALVAGPIGDSRSRAAIEATLREFPDDFRWLGPVYGPDKDAFYGSIDAFVFPSDYVNEAQPLVLLEALAAGAAVLATDRGCMGCDHAASPGLIAPVSQFHDLALHWLLNHESPSARQGLPRRAAEAFNGMRATAKSQLASVIDEIGKG